MKSGVLGKFDRLRAAFESARGAAGLHRHAGLLIAELCADLPPSPEAATFDDAAAALRLRQAHGERHRPELTADPPLSRFEFEERIATRLEHFDDAALSHWLRYGTAPRSQRLTRC